jgi:16S rRNA (cytidine1402-2'-O)-methyltransferase
VPGACAAVAALAASGLPTDSYTFLGFPPKKTGKQIQQLKQLISEPRTLIFYESPRRVISFMDNLIAIMGDRKAVLARELTKIHEEFLRGRLSEIKHQLYKRAEIKGECTLLIHGAIKEVEISWQDIHLEIERALSTGHLPLTDLSKKIARKYNVPKKKVYSAALKLKKTIHHHCIDKREVI